VTAFASRARTLELDAGGEVELRPLPELVETPHDVLLHYAYATREKAGDLGLAAYVTANAAITTTVLDAIAAQRPRAMFYASSGAVHGGGDLAENPYAQLKRWDELAFRRAMADAGGRSVVARVFNVAGPWLAKVDSFALGSLIRQVAEGGPVEVRARHAVRRSYVDVEDLAALALALAESPDAGDDLVFDTAGEVVVEVGELAERIARVLGRADAEIVRDRDDSLPEDVYVGDGTAMREHAARHGIELRELDEQIARTAEWLRYRPAPR
jgi:nucleoside-diphosphate-sugar epimerase